MKKTTIKRKILFMVLSISVVSLTVFCAVAFWGLFSIQGQMRLSSAQLGEFATQNSSMLLEREAIDKLQIKAKNRSEIINERLKAIANQVIRLSGYTSEIYENADRMAPVPIPFPVSENKGKLTMRLQSAGGKADYPRIKKEADLLGNITSVYINSRKTANIMSAIYLGTESGFSIIYDLLSDTEDQMFDPRVRPWYIGAKESRATFWTSPYTDAVSGKLMITCSHPFYGPDSTFMGITGIDVLIEDLNHEIINVRAGESGYAFVVDTEGILIASRELDNEAGAFEKRSAYREDSPEYNNIIRKMAAGETGTDRVHLGPEEVFIAYSPIPVANWSVAIVLPVSEIMNLVTENVTAIERMTQRTLNFVNSTITVTFIIFMLVFAISVFVIIYLSGKLSGKITNPIIKLKECHGRISGGELDARVELSTGDEIEELAGSVNTMAQKLKEYIDNLQCVTAEKERIGVELNIATQIQASMLPSIFPAFPDRAEFDIYATMIPAKEVGGDFYDLFLVDENTLCVVIADVSGKGVPAALFMVIAKTLIKNNVQYGQSPKEVFETVNNLLCEGNDTGMFVTAFMGYLDIRSGKFTFVNAGHNPPILRSGGAYSYFKPAGRGIILAGMEDTFYRQGEIVLQKNDEVILYTDGITEAMNNEDAQFGEPRFLEVINEYSGLPLKEFTVSIKREIDKFAEGAEQADDITMLTLRYKGIV